MKLVEILARDLNEWPGDLVLVQGCSGLVYEAGGQGVSVAYFNTASDWRLAEVTRAQWEAERARIAAMEGISAFSQEQANAEAEREKRSQYEQELWDRAALGAQVMIFEAAGSNMPLVDIASHVALWADTFMAERAKRLKR